MVSEMAIADITQLQNQGYNLTPRDIIKLNALALKFEREKSKESFKSLYTLPRIAAIDDGMYFRQPSIGHEIWLDTVDRWIDTTDYGTVLTVNAFALSRDVDDLPDANNRKEITKQINKFIKLMRKYTTDQIFAAVNYVKNDISEFNESPIRDDKNVDDVDWCDSVAVGVLREGQAVLFGVTEKEMLSMTRESLRLVIDRAYEMHGMEKKDSGDYLLGEYYSTLDYIKNKLEKEMKD